MRGPHTTMAKRQGSEIAGDGWQAEGLRAPPREHGHREIHPQDGYAGGDQVPGCRSAADAEVEHRAAAEETAQRSTEPRGARRLQGALCVVRSEPRRRHDPQFNPSRRHGWWSGWRGHRP